MRKQLFIFGLFFFQLLTTVQGQDSIILSVAKFRTGDDPHWKNLTQDESGWKDIRTDQRWEPQGYTRYNGYAWYRIRFILPTALRNNAFWKDSLVIRLGMIDDVDETFLNGVKIGQTGSLPDDPGGYVGKWDTKRHYVLPATSSLLRWDQENLIAICVFDNKEGGGLFGGIPCVRMMRPADGIDLSLQLNETPAGSCSTRISNQLGIPVTGTLTWQLIDEEKKQRLAYKSISVKLPAKGKKQLLIPYKGNRRLKVLVHFREKNLGDSSGLSLITPYILTPPAPAMPLINSPAVYGSKPGTPFLFRIAASGNKPMRYRASGLPPELTLDTAFGIISGTTPARGNYRVSINVKNKTGTAQQELEIRSGDLLALTPPMGWNSWYTWRLQVTSQHIRQAANAMIGLGLTDYGWNFINVDDGWQGSQRAVDGTIIPNEKFTDMAALGEWLHARGLKFGMYSSPGTLTCGDFTGSYQHEEQDILTYADWGVDLLKYDWCSYDDIFFRAGDSSRAAWQLPYKKVQKAIEKSGRSILYSLCQYGRNKVWEWGPDVDANLWRTTDDVKDNWKSVSGIGFSQAPLHPYASPGRWNDPDMLMLGQLMIAGDVQHPSRLTPDEQYTQVSLWSLLSAPLLIGADLTKMDPFTFSLLSNREVIAINQDLGGQQARPVLQNENEQVWIKELADGSRAVGIFNTSETYRAAGFTLAQLGLTGPVEVRDCWRQKKLADCNNEFTSMVPPHGVLLVKLKHTSK